MAKRFASTEIWEEDWFLDMPNEYKLFWFYLLSSCDHAGVFKINLKSFCALNKVDISAEIAFNFFNAGKQRIRQINGSIWLIEDFFCFQYGQNFNQNNRMHDSVKKIFDKHGVKLTSIRGLKEVK